MFVYRIVSTVSLSPDARTHTHTLSPTEIRHHTENPYVSRGKSIHKTQRTENCFLALSRARHTPMLSLSTFYSLFRRVVCAIFRREHSSVGLCRINYTNAFNPKKIIYSFAICHKKIFIIRTTRQKNREKPIEKIHGRK